MNPSLESTMGFIVHAHRGQTDKSGVPYHRHPIAVMLLLVDPTEAEKHAALLHDVVEDTSWTLADLRGIGYTEEVIEIVDLVTRRERETYFHFIRRTRDSGNVSAMKVKLADITHNLDPSRGWGGDLNSRLPSGMARRYDKALKILRGEIS